MNVLLWIPIAVASAALMMVASRRAVAHSAAVARTLRVPPFLVGVTLVALGTDAPEIVSSLVSCFLGHGDIAVGDAVGSVFTQGALILGLVPFLAGSALRVTRREAWILPALTLAALGLGIVLLSDDRLTRADGVLLALAWLAATLVAWKSSSPAGAEVPAPAARGAFGQALRALGWFALVGGGAALLVQAVAALSVRLGVPEYALSFFGASIGTSLPELVTEYTALRRGERALALGDVFGSCLIDASLSVAIGPLFFPVAIDGALAGRGSAIAAVVTVLGALLLFARRRHDRVSGAILIAAYLAGYFALGAGSAD